MAAKKELEKELKIALKEVGSIIPWYEKKMKCWLFSHELYPVACEGISRKEVIEKYPFYLKDFIDERMKGNLASFVEKKTKGLGRISPRSLAGQKEQLLNLSREFIYQLMSLIGLRFLSIY